MILTHVCTYLSYSGAPTVAPTVTYLNDLHYHPNAPIMVSAIIIQLLVVVVVIVQQLTNQLPFFRPSR